MDVSRYEQSELMQNLKERLDEHCFDFSNLNDEFYESATLEAKISLNYYLE